MPKSNNSVRKSEMCGGMAGMIVTSVLIPAILMIGALVWIAFYASGYSLFQKIVIAVIALIVICTAESLLWMAWAGKKGMGYWMQFKER